MKSPQFTRRQFLYGAGACMVLPYLESFGAAPVLAAPPKRFLGLYVGHGFAITRKDDHPARDWSWYPRVADGRMKFGLSTAAFQSLHDQVSVIYGLDHPQISSGNGHSSADSFFTGSHPQSSVISPSLDQVAAMALGKATRFPSLVLGNEGGIGIAGGSRTLSYNRAGRAIPSECSLERIYDDLFNSDPAVLRKERLLFERNIDIVDRVNQSAKDLKRRISREDNAKLESYLESVRSVEQNIARMRKWSETPKPGVGSERLSLKATVNEPALFIETMYNLIYLAFKTDSTRYVTYMLQSMGDGPWSDMSKNALGLGANHHLLAHNAAGANPKAMEKLGSYDKFQSELLAKFLRRMADTPEGNGSMLDNTIVLYGCSNSATHVNRNYPLLLAGGRNLGFRHGRFHDMERDKVPMSNLLLTILQRLDVPAERFSDSTGVFRRVLA